MSKLIVNIRLDTITDVYLAHLVLTGIITMDTARANAFNPVQVNWAVASAVPETVFELPRLENSQRAIDLITDVMGVSRDAIFISHGTVYIGQKLRIARELSWED